MNLLPDLVVVKNYKTKEIATANYIKEEFKKYDWRCDKTIPGGSSGKRPDLLLDLGDKVLLVEIDENKHKTHDNESEKKRIMDIWQDIGFRPMIIIRFNPDDYYAESKINESGKKKITSCWASNKEGICAVKKCKVDEWAYRLETLKEHIEYWIHDEIDYTRGKDDNVIIDYLFFDEC
jgi:hypothetical protein